MIWVRDFGSTKVSESPEYFVYCELFEMNCWSKRSTLIAKGEFLEVPYNLDHLSLIKKIRFSKQPAQDSGFCFSKDGKYLYNLENIDSDLSYEIARYDLNTIERATIIPSRPKCIFRQIGYSAQLHTYCILGTTHCTDTLFTQTGPFIAYFNGQEITDVYSVTEHEDYNHFMQLTTEINSNCVTSSSINKENTYGQN